MRESLKSRVCWYSFLSSSFSISSCAFQLIFTPMGSIEMPNGNGKSPSFDSAEAPPESNTSKRRRSSVLPLEVGTRVMCRWRDSKYHPVKVIERRKVPGADYEYYVHYTECKTLSPSFCFSI